MFNVIRAVGGQVTLLAANCEDLDNSSTSDRHHPLGPWSTRSNHAFGLPKLRRCCKYVSVSVRVFRSVELAFLFFFLPLPPFLMTSLS